MIRKKEFPYTNDITAVNKEQFDVHKKLYEGYVNKVNEIDSLLKTRDAGRREANATYSYYRGLKRGETYALDGVILHELYFENMGGMRQEPDPVTLGAIQFFFGNYDNWYKDFVACGKASRGWAVLLFDPRSEELRNISMDLHDEGNITGAIPVLVMDVYEHAYFLQYANNKDEYITAFMNNINWPVVSRRMNARYENEEE